MPPIVTPLQLLVSSTLMIPRKTISIIPKFVLFALPLIVSARGAIREYDVTADDVDRDDAPRGKDTIRVTLRNHSRFAVSLHLHGVNDKSGEDSDYVAGSNTGKRGGSFFAPSQTSTDIWEAREDDSRIGVDREFVTLFTIFNESQSRLTKENAHLLSKDSESNEFDNINGFFFGKLPALRTAVGEKVRRYVVGFGEELDLHVVHWHGNLATTDGRRFDVVELLPASMKVSDIPDTPGSWFHHVDENMASGTVACYEVAEAAKALSQEASAGVRSSRV
ncbi:MAG TPA: hypothetical protein VHO24_12105 [Opitutaceae bacterium]|nr:hypothetical protein [Opitutaceae bacterium]